MKYLKQFGIIVLISFIGEVLKFLIPLPVPASIYGLVLLFLALTFHIIKLEQIKETAGFLITIMPIMFVPAAVGLIDSYAALQPILWQMIVIVVLSTIVVMILSGHATQFIIHHQKKEQ